jgi:chorismate lyase/3-hydroxybenzoate synthase
VNNAPYQLLTGDTLGLDEHSLACVDYGPGASDEPRLIRPGLPWLNGPRREIWRSPVPVRQDRFEALTLAYNSEVAMGQLALDEAALVSDTAAATEAAYRQLLAAIRAAGYPHLQRTWIYIGDIHRGEGDAERYRQFCVGRARVLANGDAAAAPAVHYPAATVIGRAAPGALIYFIAAREAGQPVENPRQVSAFRYPTQYSPQPPSFSRAMRTPWDHLMVSGTAAVVGHATMHPHDAAAQLEETARNVEALLNTAGGEWAPLRAKLYLRPGSQLPPDAERRLPLMRGATVLEGTVCRADLTVEIEALFARN